MNDSSLEKRGHGFVQQSLRDLCTKFKVDRLSRFCAGARYVLTTQKRCSNRENYNIKFPLNIFSDQIIIYQISFGNL